MTASLDISMKLNETNFNLDNRSHGVSSSANLLGSLDAMSWVGIGISGVAAAALVGAGAWYLMRKRKTAGAIGSQTVTGPAPSTPPI